MNIRKDLLPVEAYLHRLLEFANAFTQFEKDNWVHLKNMEDFDKVYLLEQPYRSAFEELYARGRELAGFMSTRIPLFNYAKQYLTLADYVDSFDGGWVDEVADLHVWLVDVSAMCASVTPHAPWAVRRMIEVFGDQLQHLDAVRKTLNILKDSRLYKIEKGEVSMAEDTKYGAVIIENLTADKVNIQSTDNSLYFQSGNADVFMNLHQAIKKN